ncbi:MAG: cupin-like domain-containing protein [Acidobacteriota bacterium]|nr:cupin-like domain-containing protein [Acidobacteriota bacterium]
MAWKVRKQVDEAGAADGAGSDGPFQIKGKVGRVEEPSPQAFHRGYVQANRPVVVQGVMDRWKALNGWSWSYLCSLAGEEAGEVIVSANGLYPDYLSQPSPMTRVAMTLAEFVDRSLPHSPGQPVRPPILAPGETYYIYGKSYLFDAFPELLEDIAPPSCLGTTQVSTTSTWISSKGCVTPLHYDLPNTLLCQVRGAKQIYLFAPSQFDRLYLRGPRFPGFDNFERQSQVDIHHPDLARFPEFRGATAVSCTLRQGEALFIPSNWFHEVETLEPSISVGFTFAGGTTTSELAVLSDVFKRMGAGAPVDGMDLFNRAGGASGNPHVPAPGQPGLDPARLQQLLGTPEVQRLMADPAILESLLRLMGEAKGPAPAS